MEDTEAVSAKVGWYTRTLQRLGHGRWVVAAAARLAPPIDRFLYARTGGVLMSTGRQIIPTLLLTTVGRRTGRDRTVPVLYVRIGACLVIAGSNWGQRQHPAWSENLLANPVAKVQIGNERGAYRATRATTEERARLWLELDRIWPAYETYRKRAGRDIRVFVLEP